MDREPIIPPTQTQEQFVVAIGASAGGLEAIHEFFDHMPPDSNCSFVIIQHLSPDYKSLLVELVSKHTKMKVYEAVHDRQLEPNSVYVIPNDKLLKLQDGRLQLSEKHFDNSINTAIDIFLKSMAEDQGERAIAVILSGTGTDGTRGIEAVQQHGGLIIVQDPHSAKFDGMPNSAIAAGYADFVLSPGQMPEEIMNHAREKPGRRVNEGRPNEASLPEVLTLIEKSCGYDFHNYKSPTILRRILRRMHHVGIKDFTEYLDQLRRDGEECKALGQEFLIGVTKFFRDHAAFDIFAREVLPEIIRSKGEGDVLKVWVTACSTGQEAYSIGILINEHLRRIDRDLEIKIFATDIDIEAVETAARGSYPAPLLADIEPELLERYFTKQGSHYHVNAALRKQIVFARHNILKDPPFIKNDIVTCRNMLIYMNNVLQRRVFSTLQYGLNTGGILFLGPSEIPASISSSLQEVSSKWKIYRKTGNEKPTQQVYDTSRPLRESRVSNIVKENTTARELAEDFRNILTDEYRYAAVYVDRNYEIKEGLGDFRHYLSLPKKIVTLNVLKMVGPELAIALNSGLRKALKEGTKVALQVRPRPDSEDRPVQLIIKPPAKPDGLIMIVFGEGHEAVQFRSHGEVSVPGDPETAGYLAELEDELKETRMNLQMAVESLETTNEELQSSNEELLSANEELQSSNEELQSLNEELHTLNTEHQLRIKELLELNDDLNNYFRSTEIGQVFVDRNGRIRKFNPAAVQLINLIDSDVGRPIEHISTNVRDENLMEDVKRVLEKQVQIEKEVNTNGDRVVLMRILPYIRRDHLVDGVVITFFDITATRELHHIIKGVFNASLSAVLALSAVRDLDGHIIDFTCKAANHAADTLMGKRNYEYLNGSLRAHLPEIAHTGLFSKCVEVVETDKSLHTELMLQKAGNPVWYEVVGVRMPDGLVLSWTDITEKKEAEEKLRRNYHELVRTKENLKLLNASLEEKVTHRTAELASSEERFRLIAASTNDMVWDWNLVQNEMWWSETFYRLIGAEFHDGQIQRPTLWMDYIHPEDKTMVEHSIHESINTGRNWTARFRLQKEDGSYASISGRGAVISDEFGVPYRMVGALVDVSHAEEAERQLHEKNRELQRLHDILEQKVAERTQELTRSNADLESSNAELLQFASVASHDLKEPLRKIHIFSNIIRDRYLGGADEGAMDYITRIINSSARMTKLINDLLAYSRLSVNHFFEQVDLNAIVGEVLSDLELSIEEKGAQVDVDRMPLLEAVPGQLRQVLQNIISNALKFTRPGVTPHIRLRCERISMPDVAAPPVEDGPYLRLIISDNGIGFDDQYANKIFTIFQRLHSREKYEGTGIGLAITKKIIDRHNGVITAHSKEGEGSTFVIVLPLHQERREQATAGA
ncbi:chemotaxis protein CheB [Flaviaesturariibacter aridisoli]|uniref:PAS domain-containing protein n=1 Tax=Flaviaesturariibacter aridisoli TaxID=2545761 RepID=A0A4R4DZ01_9BACT|nr:chemotaxis protein CheB [Flaviaesturariibacter aridisoli]TCZ71359.1 PAS domain-containing protein [Flaviaesturariibacter aridisoli]